MNKDLESKAKVVLDLLEKGAEEVIITATDLKVIRTKHATSSTGSPTQIVNVQTQAIAQNSTSIDLKLNLAKAELEKLYRNQQPKLSEIQEKFNLLEAEVQKTTPNKTNFKKILEWALNFGWDVFVKIAPIIIDKILMK